MIIRFKNAKQVISQMQLKNVTVHYFSGHTVAFMKKINCKYIIRGIRNSYDLVYEQKLAKLYFAEDSNIEIFYLLSKL